MLPAKAVREEGREGSCMLLEEPEPHGQPLQGQGQMMLWPLLIGSGALAQLWRTEGAQGSLSFGLHSTPSPPVIHSNLDCSSP